MNSSLEYISKIRCFDGWLQRISHFSEITKCKMTFSIYLPPQSEKRKLPVIWFLSGLTCNDENFFIKSGAQRFAALKGIILIAPDTSPRGINIPGDSDHWDFGVGASFYLDATESKWKTNYNMYSYITKELPELIIKNFPVIEDKQSIMGHSMGGHGALICSLKNPGKYKSVSAFAPISNPTQCPWGQKAFSGYLGNDKEKWKNYDASELVKSYNGPNLNILIDQGTYDKFYIEKQLLPENFKMACEKNNFLTLNLRMQEFYDHSYFFISTFISDHLEYHSQYLF